jgi:hypothetical protein
MPLYEVTSDHFKKFEETSFGAASIRERTDLQRLLRNQIEVITPEVMVIAEEFGEWEDSRRRIDLLAVDKNANLVVIELKRTEDGGHMELQALRYAAMVSTMTFDEAVAAYGSYPERLDREADPQQELLDFLGWDEPDENHFAEDVRIVLVSAEFSKELTTTVLWLNDQGLDLRCVRMKPYNDNGRTLVDVQQVIPLPETSDYQIKVSVKTRKERIARTSTRDLTKYDMVLYGVHEMNLAKRNAMFYVIKGLCDHGVNPDEISRLINWKLHLFLAFDGRLSSEEFIQAGAAQYELENRLFAERRWFCATEELIYSNNKTYALTKQWGKKWKLAVDILKENFLEAKISYQVNDSV